MVKLDIMEDNEQKHGIVSKSNARIEFLEFALNIATAFSINSNALIAAMIIEYVYCLWILLVSIFAPMLFSITTIAFTVWFCVIAVPDETAISPNIKPENKNGKNKAPVNGSSHSSPVYPFTSNIVIIMIKEHDQTSHFLNLGSFCLISELTGTIYLAFFNYCKLI